MCLVGTVVLLDIGLSTCAHQIGSGRFGIGGGCAIAASGQRNSVANRAQIGGIAHAGDVCVGRTLYALNKSSPADHSFARIQPYGRCYTDQHWAHIFYHENNE